MTIFHDGATIVPDIVTEAEEQRILLRIAQAPWMSDLSRRVQHYGFRYNYRGPANGRHDPAPPFPRWAAVIGDRLSPFFDGAMPEQCIVNEYRPGQGIGMHADTRQLRARRRVPVARRRLDNELPAPFGPPLRPRGAGDRRDRAVAATLRPRPARAGALGVHARDRPCRQRAPGHDARLRDVPHGFVLISAAVSVRAEGKVPGYPAGLGADGEGEVVRSLEKGEREGDREGSRPVRQPIVINQDE